MSTDILEFRQKVYEVVTNIRIIFFIYSINKDFQTLALCKRVFFLVLNLIVSKEWKKGRKIESGGEIVRWIRPTSRIGGFVLVSMFFGKFLVHFEIELCKGLFDWNWIRLKGGFDKIVKMVT